MSNRRQLKASGGRQPTEEPQTHGVCALLIGDADHAEFRGAVQSLSSETHLHRVADLAAANRLLADGLRPDVIILAQQRPGEFEPPAVDALRRHVPLAPVVALQSSWCEGEGRIGRPLPGVVRISWRRFEADIVPGLIQLRDGQVPDWAGPATLTPEERLLQQSSDPLPDARGTVGIVSPSYEMRRLLSDACRAGGWNPTEWPMSSLDDGARATCDVLVCDLDELPAESSEAFATLRSCCESAPTVVLIGFAREDEIERARSIGATIVGKPFSIGEILSEIERATSRRRVPVAKPQPDSRPGNVSQRE